MSMSLATPFGREIHYAVELVIIVMCHWLFFWTSCTSPTSDLLTEAVLGQIYTTYSGSSPLKLLVTTTLVYSYLAPRGIASTGEVPNPLANTWNQCLVCFPLPMLIKCFS